MTFITRLAPRQSAVGRWQEKEAGIRLWRAPAGSRSRGRGSAPPARVPPGGPITASGLAAARAGGRRVDAAGLEPRDEVAVRRRLDDPGELRAVVGHQADALDDDVVDHPAAVGPAN